ncbi:WD40 repeat-like protein [Coccomyxa subellipsoidea C-169]|uniref:WD40 repeat-like protein n=1 Tax=Coccomyxa subellipsoidea (strain C-169) TaxID=574566 RepID=I0YUJ3_COCSC|nr:WD40 repeat-like protein [Coccomyxa subellipsoidea C-169]EIE22062.1 WD40 repeat-like protein [Coccomyxa subellipsoidea C-169]|eukprot:XP_005646606.1 WD40 repeat-like protein [Coccomyxa subellipsoidea C-169]
MALSSPWLKLDAAAPDVLLSSSLDGTVRGWDLRSGQQIQQFAAGKGMGLNALAVSGDTLAAGSDGCVYFWDRRSHEQLACFDDTHPEAVTQVLYHQQNFISGSMDGLINVADFSDVGLNEDDSFKAALNLDASVSRLGFYGEQQEHLWCLSHTDTLHLWDWQTACDEEAEGGEGSLADVMDVKEQVSEGQSSLPSVDYLVGCSYSLGALSIAAGSSCGSVGIFDVSVPSRSGEDCSFSGCRMLLKGGHSDVVRSALWPSERSPVFFTAGEDARICAWSTVAGLEDGAGKRSLGDAGESQPQKKRKKQKGT